MNHNPASPEISSAEAIPAKSPSFRVETIGVIPPQRSGESVANRLREMADGERPQERMERFGPGALSDTELLAMLLRTGTRGQDVMTLSSRLIAEAGSIAGLASWRECDFLRLRGIGRVKALQLLAVTELARRAFQPESGAHPLLDRCDRIAALLEPRCSGLRIEKFWVLCLNRRNRLLRGVEIASGGATSVQAHPREVYRVAVGEAAAAVVCAHNHPSGDPSPSVEDIRLTRRLREASTVVDIPLLDHVIVGSKNGDPRGCGFYSFREAGML